MRMSSGGDAPLVGGPARRRNGKQQACEPCRKGKLACDHGAPHCGRCLRRKMTARCIYHPAPMTKSRSSGGMQSPRSPASSSTSNHMFPPLSTTDVNKQFRQSITHGSNGPGVRHLSQSGSTIDPSLTDPSSGSLQTPPSDPKPNIFADRYDWDKEAVFKRSARFYGETSFSAVFNENVNLSEDLRIGDNGRKHPGNWQGGEPLLGRERPGAPSVRMNHIVKALWNIPSREVCEKLLETFDPEVSIHSISMTRPMISHFTETLWSTFGNELATPRDPERLSLIADVMFKNEETPLPEAPEDGMEWINGFMGKNLRFEMLAMGFVAWGASFQILQEWDPLFKVPENEGRDRKESSWRMKECADVCLKMCELSEENNDISISAQYSCAVLESVCTGDETFQTRRRIGEIIVCAIAAGLHRLPAYGPNYKVTAASEFKRRLFASIYDSDKNHASLNGIPPALSLRFCNLRLPFDISDEDLFFPDRLANAVIKLDARGWNTSGVSYMATYHRSYVEICRIREDILDISLGIDVPVSASTIDSLHQRVVEMYAGFPEQCRYCTPEGTPKLGGASIDLVKQAYLLLTVLQNKFLIDRVAIARGIPREQSLLDTAMEMCDHVTMFWKKRDQLMAFSSAFDWIVMAYGIPCAGVICVQLLKQAAGNSDLQLSRSDAIQKLTMFIGFLEWIRPTDGNFQLAGRLRKVVRSILDRVLDPPSKETLGSEMMEMQVDPMLAPFAEMDWLNTIDWTQGSWTEFN